MGVSAHRNHVVERLTVKVIQQFAAVPANVNINFAHHLNRVRIQAMGLDPSRIRSDKVRLQVVGKPFSHLAAAGISSAQKQKVEHR